MSAQGSYSLVSPPQKEPLTLDEVKAHLRVEYDFTDDDIYIESLISAARRYTEAHSSFFFMTQSWKLSLDCFPSGTYGGEIIIRKRPINEVYSIEYIDDAGVRQTLSNTKYQVDIDCWLTRIRPVYGEVWPTTRRQMNAAEVLFTAGFENTIEGIPHHLREGLLLLIGHWYENREDTVRGLTIATVPKGYDALVGIERVLGL